MHDVIVIGGGLTGSHTARRLAETGHSVLVLEKNAAAGQKSCCTGIIGQECVDTFKIDSRVILKQVNSAILFSPSGNSLHLYRPETQAVILDRSAFDISMAERAQRAGVEYRFNSRVTDAAISADCVHVTVAGGKKDEHIPARAVVIASGFAPGLSERLGLGAPKDFTIGAQAEVAASGLDEVEVYFGNIAPGFFGWLVPTGKETARVGLLARNEAGLRLKKWLHQLEEQGKIKSADVAISYGGIPLKPPPRTYGERMVAVGDAAGQVKPTTGGGIYYGLLGVEIAGDILHRALEVNDLSAKSLSRYERAWRRKLGGEIRTGYWTRKFFERLNERQIDQLFKIIKASGIDEALLKAADLSFDWHSRTIKSLLKYQIVVKSFNLIKLPFQPDRIDR
ncbi:MAG: NAD(P)/FAD-dependent oxidoreductase [Dehalococcoidales bacterium]